MVKKKQLRRRPFETAAFRVGLFLIPRLPRCAVLGLAQLGGRLGYRLDRTGRRIGEANLNIAFGDSKTAREKKRILKTAYITMARTFLDVIWFGTNSAKRLAEYVEADRSIEPLFCSKNQICITAHFGSWEVIGQMMAQRGFSLHSIAMPVKNPEVDRLLIRRREVTGQKIVPLKGALKTLLGVLRSGGKAAFLVDQNTPEERGGIWADYFGLPVPVTPAPASLAAKTGSEIFIGFCAPQPRGHYRVYITQALPVPENSDRKTVQTLTQQTLMAIEREVRMHPEHWLWMYKRWKTIRDPKDATRYPFYADRR
ncbi:MAG: lysophospholipid acyltransferase family protein [Kiritimatiellales bacterium]